MERQRNVAREHNENSAPGGSDSADRLAAAQAQANRVVDIGNSAIDRVLTGQSQRFLAQVVNGGAQ
ncbi:MAG: hypothetical protein ACKVX7_09640 [Planctomycetota bacterium]